LKPFALAMLARLFLVARYDRDTILLIFFAAITRIGEAVIDQRAFEA